MNNIVAYILSILFAPIAGPLIWYFCKESTNPEYVRMGKMCLKITLVVVIITMAFYGIVIGLSFL